MENRIKMIMKRKKVMSKDLAAKMSISTVALSKLIYGHNPMSMDRAKQFAEALDVEFWELFYTREELLNSINNENAGNTVSCPFCGKSLILSIK